MKKAKIEKPGESVVKRTSKATVTVACKMPNGMILQLCKPMVHREPILGGGAREVTQWHPYGPKVKVHGPARPFGAAPATRVVGGYALTSGVPADFFAEWLEQHKEDAVVVNKMIMAHGNPNWIAGWAKDHRTLQSGLQPLKVGLEGKGAIADPRVPKKPGEKMTLETADLVD